MPRVASRIGDLEVSYLIGVQTLAAEESAIETAHVQLFFLSSSGLRGGQFLSY